MRSPCSSGSAPMTSTGRRRRGVRPVPGRARRDAGRRHDHPPRRGSVPGPDRSRLSRLRPRLDPANVRPDEACRIRDVTAEFSVIGLWGPRARDIAVAAGSTGIGARRSPLRRAGAVRIGDTIPALATRISYAGELGWEFTLDPDLAVARLGRPVASISGHRRGSRPIGYRAIDALRLEKGFRYYGAELTTQDAPMRPGWARSFASPSPIRGAGRRRRLAGAASGRPGARLRTVTIGGDGWLPIYGGEAVRVGGEVAGRLRSAAFGYAVRSDHRDGLPAGFDRGGNRRRGRRLRWSRGRSGRCRRAR